MEKKKCSVCKIEKEFNDFSKDKNKKNGIGNSCKECMKSYMKTYYQENKIEFSKQVKINKTKTKTANRANMFLFLQNKTCKDCNMSDIRVLEFDHLRDKHKSINEMLQTGYAWKSILEEIKKCDIVCANCHKIRTYSRSKTYRG